MDTLSDLLRKVTDPGPLPYAVPGTVTAVDKAAGTVDVSPVDDSADLLAVRLRADEGTGFTVYPVVGSLVLVSFLSPNEAFVSMVSQVDTYELTTQAGESLKTLLTDFLDQVIQLKVLTNTGASLSVVNAPQLTQIKQRLTRFFHA